MIQYATTLKCKLAPELWPQLDMTSPVKYDHGDFVDWGRNCAVNFDTGKLFFS